jgi:hypothetical protein
VAAGLVFFFSRLFEGDFEHGERLSLLPLEDDTGETQADEGGEDIKVDDKPDLIGSNAPGETADASRPRD